MKYLITGKNLNIVNLKINILFTIFSSDFIKISINARKKTPQGKYKKKIPN